MFRDSAHMNSLIIVTTLFDRIRLLLPLPAHGRKKTQKGGKIPFLAKRGRGDFVKDVYSIMRLLTRQLQKKAYRNRAGVFEKPCSGTFMSRLHAFPGRTRTSLKVNSSVTPSFLIIRNCKGLKIPPPGVRYCNIWVNKWDRRN
jgi:hypothetical protein